MNCLLRSIALCLSLTTAIACGALPLAAQDIARGEAVYKAQCVSCHGADGQGTADKYNEPLAGDLSVTELAKVIDETMPEGARKNARPKTLQRSLRMFTKPSTPKWPVNACDRRVSNWPV